MFNDDVIKLKGHLSVIIKDKNGRKSEEINIGSNVIEARSKFVLSRLLGSNQKSWPAGAAPFPNTADEPSNWPTAAIGYPDSVMYPFSNDQTLMDITSRITEEGYSFGGIQQTAPTFGPYVPGTGEDDFPENFNAGNTDNCIFHPTGSCAGGILPATIADLLYSMGVTGMAFGNGGHLIRNPDAPYTLTYFKKLAAGVWGYGLLGHAHDGEQFILDSADTSDDYTRPAQPPSNTIGLEGYLPYGSSNRNIPGTTYVPVENGIVPWRESYALTGDLQDNYYETTDHVTEMQTHCVEEPNSTLYSETGRFTLDQTTGISYPTWKSVQFQCTIPVDTELNQVRRYGYGTRPRNLITEAGLICGENVLVQSPDPRTAGPIDTTSGGISNIHGAYLYDVTGTSGIIVGPKSLRKDFFSKATPEATYLTAAGQLDVTGNNTWNLFARRCFGVLTKNSDYSFTFVWSINF